MSKFQVQISCLMKFVFPPTFIWHTVTDPQVPVENSMLFAQALRKAEVPFSLHLFSSGRHGISLATAETSREEVDSNHEVSIWPDLFYEWVKQNYL